MIAERLADPDPIVTRAGSIKRAERSHQLDPTGAAGMGSLRLQDTYRIDPNDLRSLPPGVAWIVTGGRAGKVAIARGEQAVPRGGRAPLANSPRRDPERSEGVGRGDPVLVRESGGAETFEGCSKADGSATSGDPATGPSTEETPPLLDAAGETTPQAAARAAEVEPPVPDEAPARPARSPYAQGL